MKLTRSTIITGLAVLVLEAALWPAIWEPHVAMKG
jgi:hypothetical protein